MRSKEAQATASPFMAEAEAGSFLGVSKGTLQNWRLAGTGPPFRRHGARVLYHRDELLEWSTQRRRTSTSEGDPLGPSAA